MLYYFLTIIAVPAFYFYSMDFYYDFEKIFYLNKLSKDIYSEKGYVVYCGSSMVVLLRDQDFVKKSAQYPVTDDFCKKLNDKIFNQPKN